MRRTLLATCGAGLMAFVMGCVPTTVTPEPKPQPKGNQPEWVTKRPREPGKAIYGVGTFAPVGINLALAQNAAEARARGAVSEVLSTFVASVLKDYMKSALADGMAKPQEDQLVERVAKNISMQTLVGCEIMETYNDPATKTFYALARLPVGDNIAIQLKRETQDALKTERLNKEAADAHKDLDKLIQSKVTQMY